MKYHLWDNSPVTALTCLIWALSSFPAGQSFPPDKAQRPTLRIYCHYDTTFQIAPLCSQTNAIKFNNNLFRHFVLFMQSYMMEASSPFLALLFFDRAHFLDSLYLVAASSEASSIWCCSLRDSSVFVPFGLLGPFWEQTLLMRQLN